MSVHFYATIRWKKIACVIGDGYNKFTMEFHFT